MLHILPLGFSSYAYHSLEKRYSMYGLNVGNKVLLYLR